MSKQQVVKGNDWLQFKKSTKGIGNVIGKSKAPELIAGVEIVEAALHPDDRGYFMELIRMGQKGPAAHFNPATTQVSVAMSYTGTIKAFHYHLEQTDFWCPAAGMFQVALVDLRSDSPSWGRKNTLYLGALRPWHILIPPGVGHGYKIIGPDPAMLAYVTDKFYNPKDEGRIVYNHKAINYDWETQYK